MIRMIESRAAGHAKSYFSDALAKSDYYTSDQELEGFWQGKLASRLGLSGAMDRDTFFALCENAHPQTGGNLTPRTKEERRVGYDINFHCPKSVSILHSLSGDDHILNAFRASVTETMQAIEADAQTRVRKDGAFTNRPTGELVWGHFVHQTARPVEGHLPDPHLHSHCFVFNATWDETEQRYKAGEFGDIKRDMPYYQARFQKTLSDKLATLGYAIQKTAKGFEIVGVPQEAIDLFSKRTDEIGRVAKEKGITDAKELGELGARTRAKKQKAVSMSDLKREWLKEINALPIDVETASKPVRHATPEDTLGLTASECLDFALLHSFERASVLADRRVLAAAYRHSIGHAGASVEAITEAFKGDKRIIHVPDKGRTVCTTREVLAEEKRMVQLARQGQGKLKPLYSEAPDTGLAGQQAEAAAHVLTTPHRVSIIRGVAGAGKTTLLKAFAKKVEEAGHSLTVVAPTSQASRGVLREEGFGTAETVAKLLTDERMQQKLQGQVLVVDEAGLLGTKDMTALLELATQKNARLVLVGDTRQHASVVRGDALRILNTVGGIKSAEVSKIYRQTREEYRAAVTDLSQGYIREAFEKLDGLDFIRELDPLNPNEEIVNAYMDAVVKGRSALVVSPTHAQGEAVTAAIRDRLKAEGILGGKDSTVYRLQTANLTVAEKSDARNFQKGQVVQFSQNVTGFRRGSRWTVAETDGKTVTLQNGKGETKPMPIEHSGRYEVYNPRDLALAKGDAVLITNNGFDQTGRRLNNGTMLTVERIDKNGLIVLRQPQSHEQYLLPKDFGHITHAHCITSYASQGKTVDEVFIYQPAATFPATDAKQFYVSVSRGRTKAHIYTDDKEELLHHASEMGERKSALEVLGINKMKIDFDGRKERQEQEKIKTKPRTKTKGQDHDFIR